MAQAVAVAAPAPTAEDTINEILGGLSKLNAVAKTITGSSEMKVAEAVVPGLAQIVADIQLVEDGVTFVTAAAPIVEGLIDLLSKRNGGHLSISIRPATTEQLDAIEDEKDAL